MAMATPAQHVGGQIMEANNSAPTPHTGPLRGGHGFQSAPSFWGLIVNYVGRPPQQVQSVSATGSHRLVIGTWMENAIAS